MKKSNIDPKVCIPIESLAMDQEIRDMVKSIIDEIEQYGYIDSNIKQYYYIKEIIEKGKEISKEVFQKVMDECKKQGVLDWDIQTIQCMFYVGMGAVYLYKYDEKFNINKVLELILKGKNILDIDNCVFDIFDIPINTDYAAKLMELIYNCSGMILSEPMNLYSGDAKEYMNIIIKCMLAMYTAAVMVAVEILK